MVTVTDAPPTPKAEARLPRRLFRSCDDRMLGGVAGGIAEYLDVDSTLVRLVVLLLVFSGVGFLLYIVAWIIIPENPNCKVHPHRPSSGDIGERAQDIADEVRERVVSQTSDERFRDSRNIWGLVLIGLGIMFLFQSFFNFDVGRLWPLILVAVGLAIIFGRGGKR